MTGFHQTGFYTWLDRPTDCNARRPPSASWMNVTASYNAAFYTAPSLFDCERGSVSPGLDFDLRGIGFPGRRSISCAIRRADGAIDVFVAAQGGRWRDAGSSPEFKTALFNYSAWLHTRPERARIDVASFRTLLSRLRIRSVSR